MRGFFIKTKPACGGFRFYWLADKDYSPLRDSPLRGRLRRSSSLRSLVEPEVLISVRHKNKTRLRRVPVLLAGGQGFEP